MNADLNILRWYDSLEEQERFKRWAYGNVPYLPVELNQLPPFQKIRPKTGAVISRFELVSFKTGVVTDVLSVITTSGLQVLEPSGKTYDIIMYPATVRLSSPTFEPGGYYAVMGDGQNVWYSEVFTMREYIGDHIKLEWCHNRDFEFPGGHFQYTSSGFGNGYKNQLFIDTDIAKPQPIIEKEVKERDGKVFPTKWIWKKQSKFDFTGNEFLLDAISLVEGHDVIKITDTHGNILIVDEFEVSEIDWGQNGFLGTVTVTFVTDTVVIPIYGNGTATDTCEVAPGTCIPATGSFYQVKSDLISGSFEWVNGQYFNSDGVRTDLTTGDYVTAGPSGSKLLYQYVSPNVYTSVSLLGFYTKIYYKNTNEYWYDRGEGLGIRESNITGYTPLTNPPTFYGQTGNGAGAIYELWLRDAGGGMAFVRQTDNTTLSGVGEQVDSTGYDFLVLKTVTVKCGVIMEYVFAIPLDYTVFTIADDDDSVILTGADDDDTIMLGSPDIPSVPSIP